MQFDLELLLLAMAPVFLACMSWEAWHLHRTRPHAGLNSWRNTLRNAALA
ncbi:MAG TPA: sterol desaturase family protein, partial [Paraburkholderia sp.]|nr:sterol desaturase family protein [Paraburkholderia sp.]